ncbi:MAG: 50S ribosomal protein L7ae [Firmicutes bacterium]|nr:50S ribosomal protein L7ae [Bacillota bacterium]
MSNQVNKVYSYLGLATRAGQVVSGEEAVLGAVRRGKVVLLIISEDASANTHRKFRALAQNNNVKVIVYGEKNLIGQAMGKSPRAVVGIADPNFANVIQESVGSQCGENN